MDKETLIEMMKKEYPSSYEGVKDRINDMDVQEISDMMEFLDMSLGDQSKKQGSGIMSTEDAQLVSFNEPKGMASPSGESAVFIEDRGMASPSGDSGTFIEERGMAEYQDPFLREEYDKYVFDMLEQGLEPMSFDDFRRAALAGEAKAPTETIDETIKERKVITLAEGGIASLLGA